MTQRYGDLVQEQIAAPGTSAFTLGTPSSGYVAFSTIPNIASNDIVEYLAIDISGSPWEVGLGTWTSGSLARTAVLRNSSGTTATINFTGTTLVSNVLTAKVYSESRPNRFVVSEYKYPVDSDDTNSIQRAINAAIAAGSNAEIIFSSNTYSISSAISITTTGNSSIALVGDSAQSVIINQTADADVFDVSLSNWGGGISKGPGAFRCVSMTIALTVSSGSSTRKAINVTSSAVTGAVGPVTVIDDVVIISNNATNYFAQQISIVGIGNLFLSRLQLYNATGAGVGLYVAGTSTCYTTGFYARDINVFLGQYGVQLGNYLQGIHFSNLNCINGLYSVYYSSTAGINEEIQITQSYLDGKFYFNSGGTGSVNTLNITSCYFDSNQLTSGSSGSNTSHVYLNNIAGFFMTGCIFNGPATAINYLNGLTITGSIGTGASIANTQFSGYQGTGCVGFAPAITSGVLQVVGMALINCTTTLVDTSTVAVVYSPITQNNATTYSAIISNLDATFNSVKAGLGGSSVSSNTAFGNSCLTANTSGANNSAFGQNALNSNTTGGQNTAFGFYALGYNTTGGGSTAFGMYALLHATTGGNNTAFGYNAGNGVTTGSNNCFFGENSGQSIQTSVGVVVLGSYAGASASPNGTTYISNGYALLQATFDYYGNLTLNGNKIVIPGSTSGTTTIQPSAVAGTTTFTFPGTNGVSGYYLVTDGSGNTSWKQTSLTFANVSAPAAAASTSAFTMQGLAVSISPAVTGRIKICISGTITSTTTTVDTGLIYQIAYGTGTAPSNGAAATGTVVGSAQEFTLSSAAAAAADVNQPFSLTVALTSVPTGIGYWVDLQAKAVTTASVTKLTNIMVVLEEI